MREGMSTLSAVLVVAAFMALFVLLGRACCHKTSNPAETEKVQ